MEREHVTPEQLRAHHAGEAGFARSVGRDGDAEFHEAAASTIEALKKTDEYPVARFHETCGWEIWDGCPACGGVGEVFVRPCTVEEAASAVDKTSATE